MLVLGSWLSLCSNAFLRGRRVVCHPRLGFWYTPASISSGLCREVTAALLDLQSQHPLLTVHLLSYALRQVVVHHQPPPPPKPSSASEPSPPLMAAQPVCAEPLGPFLRSLLDACPSLPQSSIHSAVLRVLCGPGRAPLPRLPNALPSLLQRLLDLSLVLPLRLAGPMAVGVLEVLTRLEATVRKDGEQTLMFSKVLLDTNGQPEHGPSHSLLPHVVCSHA
jgi:hypothetical protein